MPRFSRRPSRRSIEQLADGSAQALHLRHVPDRDIRVANKEEVALKSKAEEFLDRFAVLRTLEPVPHPEKDLVEPRRRFPQNVLDVRLEVAIENDGKKDAGIVVDERYPKVVNRADTRFPVARLSLDLWQALAEQFCSAGGNLADAGNLSLLSDTLAGPVRLTGHMLRH